MAKTNNADKARREKDSALLEATPGKKVVIAGAGDPPPSLGRAIAEQLATQQTHTPANFSDEPDAAPEAQPMTLTLPPLPPIVELNQAPGRYFISATMNFFKEGYQSVTVAGVRTLIDEDLDNIENLILSLFESQLDRGGLYLFGGRHGLPKDLTLTINTINRL